MILVIVMENIVNYDHIHLEPHMKVKTVEPFSLVQMVKDLARLETVPFVWERVQISLKPLKSPCRCLDMFVLIK
jgi:hypothetical protein